MSEETASLTEDFADILGLVKTLRKSVHDNPIVKSDKGDLLPNPARTVLANQELHLRGLARLCGPSAVEKEIILEFRECSEWARKLIVDVAQSPDTSLVIGILRNTQTHIRGCAQILANAKSGGTIPDEYGGLFAEPDKDA